MIKLPDPIWKSDTVLWNADLLIILRDINGIYDKSPVEHKDAKLIELVDNIDELEKTYQ